MPNEQDAHRSGNGKTERVWLRLGIVDDVRERAMLETPTVANDETKSTCYHMESTIRRTSTPRHKRIVRLTQPAENDGRQQRGRKSLRNGRHELSGV